LIVCPALLGQSLVREEKPVVVDGATEVWRLVWKHPPKPACPPDDADSFTCPCSGFAFGERGQLDLVRLRDGNEIERLALTPLFRDVPVDPPEAVVSRWERLEQDTIAVDALVLERRIRARPVSDVMDLADYDHNGGATEFFLQTGTIPCGKREGVVIGVSAKDQHLHVFGSLLHPTKPLYLRKEQWEGLKSSAGPVRVRDVACGDHGALSETEIELQATGEGIRAYRLEYGCDAGNHRAKLLGRTQF
jgi:hypothetical protein